MMSLKPRNVDFQETWANLKETVAGVVGLRGVERSVWNRRFSDVYALCVAHPEPLADKLYTETRNFLEEHVSGLLARVQPRRGDREGLLARYVEAWEEYSQGISYLNSLYSYLNLQHVKRQKVSDAEIIYGSAALVSSPEHDSRQLEVGELGLVTWERVMVGAVGTELSAELVAALGKARDNPPDPSRARLVSAAVHSLVQVQSFRVRCPLALYGKLVLEPYLAEAAGHHARFAADLLQGGDISHYMKHVLDGLEREISLAARFLHRSSASSVRSCYERAAVAAHLPALHAHAPDLMRAATDEDAHERRQDLRRMYQLLRPLAAQGALQPLVACAREQVQRDGITTVHAPNVEPHIQFVTGVVSTHKKYSDMFNEVFDGAQVFIGALDKACSHLVNAKLEGESVSRAPELVARYCDALLRRKGAAAPPANELDDKLADAILVFKYVDDKDVFQKHYARALARRLIHHLSTSMDQEEAMINRLKAACGYEFTNKLHRMFTDVAVSADLNNKFQHHLTDNNLNITTGFFVQVLQAGAWPLGGGAVGVSPPAQLERPARLFDSFYRAAFSGRRLAWLHHLCTGEMRTRYTKRVYHLSATTPQCAILLCFETEDVLPAREVRDRVQLSGEAWARHVRPLVDAGLLTATLDESSAATPSEDSPVDGQPDAVEDGVLQLNLNFSCKRTKIRLACAAATQPSGGTAGSGSATPGEASGSTGGSEAASCEDDRKMYLQAAIVRVMKQRKVARHQQLVSEVALLARASFAPSVALIKKCIEALIDKQYLERTPDAPDTYSYLA